MVSLGRRAACIAALVLSTLGCTRQDNDQDNERKDAAARAPDTARSDSGAVDLARGIVKAGEVIARAVAGDTFEVTGVLVGAGDIGRCSSTGHDETARLLDGIGGIVFTLGDNAYPDGAPARFTECYARSWGRHRARTRPTVGNHDYRTRAAAGYYDYFGDAAGPRGKGYYSYELGGWHVLALNSVLRLDSWSPQMNWIRQDLAANSATCTVAYWHESRFSSGEHGTSSAMRAVWEVLYATGVDVVVTAHDHHYERFAPQAPTGVPDPQHGIRAFVVGTGGAGLRPLGVIRVNSEFRDASHFGVLKLELGKSAYRWSFVTTPDGEVADSGTGLCH